MHTRICAFLQALRIGGLRRPEGAGRAFNESERLAAIKLLKYLREPRRPGGGRKKTFKKLELSGKLPQ
jgi:hypothetical protein